MTLLEIKNQLLTFFAQGDTFYIPKDSKSIKVGKNQEKHKEQILEEVLRVLTEEGFCSAIKNKEGIVDSFIMNIPMIQQGYDINISLITANLVGEIINQFANATGNKAMLTDKTSINESDIQNLCVICAQLADSQDGGLNDGTNEESGKEGED